MSDVQIQKEFYENGVISYIKPYRDGKLDGIVRQYATNGRLWKKSRYVNGVQNGRERVWHILGDRYSLWFERWYKNGELHGVEKDYYISGKLRRITIYENGKKHGVEREFYENGNLKREVTFVNDKKDGIETYYWEQGHISYKTNYVNGEENGLCEVYDFDIPNKIYLLEVYENGTSKAIFEHKENNLFERWVDE